MSFDFNVAYSSRWGYSLINTLKLKKKYLGTLPGSYRSTYKSTPQQTVKHDDIHPVTNQRIIAMKLWRRKGFINANQKEGSASFWKKQTCYQFEYLCSARVLAQSWKHIRIQFLTHEHRQHEIIRTRGRWAKTQDRLWEVGTCGGCNPLKCQMNQPFASESLAWCGIILILAFSFFMSSTQQAIHLTPARHHTLNIIGRSLA